MPHAHRNLPDGVAIGPDGQFVSVDEDMLSDIEVATFASNAAVAAADLDGTTSLGGQVQEFESIEVIDYDEIVDRNEELLLLDAKHSLVVYANSTETADGTVAAAVEVSADPSLTDTTGRVVEIRNNDLPPGDSQVIGTGTTDDSIDLIGRPLSAVGHAPFSDGSSGAGGGGSAGEDRLSLGMAPAEFGRFHPRDELFVNGSIRAWNIDDAGVHVNVSGQHVYGVVEG